VADSLVARPKPAWLKRERDGSEDLPYTRHVTDQIVALDSGALMLSLRVNGASFETADIRDLNDWHAKLNGAWRNLASEQLAIWHHLIRREQSQYPEGDFRSQFARQLDQAYRGRIEAEKLYANELYLTLVLHPGRDPSDRAQHLLGRWAGSANDARALTERTKILADAGRDLGQHLARYGLTPLALYQRDGLIFSQPLELLRLVLSGRAEPAPLVRGRLGQAIYADRVIFGREALEIRDPARARLAGMLGIKEYPAATRPGLWNGLLSAPFALVATQSFSFLSKAAASAVLSRKQNQMLSARDRAASQISGLDQALDDLTSNRFVMGDHQASVLVYADDMRQLGERLSKARALLADCGLVAVREDLGLEAGFWAQFPGNFRHRVRPAAINSRNFAAFAPLHAHPAGRASGNHWGPAVALMRTASGSPYYFNFHVGDVGHTFICGPTGAGKTVIQNFTLSQAEKFGAKQVFIDNRRSAEIFVRACGGTYLELKPGVPTGLAPFKAPHDGPGQRVFLASLVRQLAAPADRPLTPNEALAIDDAVAALARLAPAQRSLAAVRALLGQRDPSGLGTRLERWCRGGPLGWVLDNDVDLLDLEPDFVGFDITHFLDLPEIRTPIILYLFHRIQALVDGRRLIVDVDEFWKALGDEAFRGLAREGLKTYRMQNALMVFATQSPADVLASPIAPTILEQCVTKIFLPNPHASRSDYIDGFGLSEREFALVRHELAPQQRRFLIKQGVDSVVAELGLGGLDDALAVLSGRTETVGLLDRVRAEHGNDPAFWMKPFQEARRRL
jgi:type IV secretion system protein VirB4